VPPPDSPVSALSGVVNGLDLTPFANIALGIAPTDQDFKGMWLYLTIEPPAPDNSDKLLAAWEGDLVQGATAEVLSQGNTTDLANVVVGYSLAQLQPDGAASTIEESASGDVTPGQDFNAPSDSVAREAIENYLTKRGFGVQSVRILHPLQSALYVRVQVPSDKQAIDASELFVSLADGGALGSTDRSGVPFEGVYLQILDAEGRVAAVETAAYRSASFRFWSNPDSPLDVGLSAH
jgi:hypothetical protein